MTDQEWADLFAQEDAKRDAEREAAMAQARATCHIRKRAGRSLGNQFYSHSHRVRFREGHVDPQSQTLCGGDATIADLSWSETRHAKARTYVACHRCIELRVADSKAVGA